MKRCRKKMEKCIKAIKDRVSKLLEPEPIIYKCYICKKEDALTSLKIVQSHVLVCGYYGEYHPAYYFHPNCLKEALALEDGYYSHSKVDRAIEITESIKMWQDKKTAALETVNKLDLKMA